jgi:hypothetical protein
MCWPAMLSQHADCTCASAQALRLRQAGQTALPEIDADSKLQSFAKEYDTMCQVDGCSLLLHAAVCQQQASSVLPG